MKRVLIVFSNADELLSFNLRGIGYECYCHTLSELSGKETELYDYVFVSLEHIAEKVLRKIARHTPNVVVYGQDLPPNLIDKNLQLNSTFSYLQTEKITKRDIVNYFLKFDSVKPTLPKTSGPMSATSMDFSIFDKKDVKSVKKSFEEKLATTSLEPKILSDVLETFEELAGVLMQYFNASLGSSQYLGSLCLNVRVVAYSQSVELYLEDKNDNISIEELYHQLSSVGQQNQRRGPFSLFHIFKKPCELSVFFQESGGTFYSMGFGGDSCTNRRIAFYEHYEKSDQIESIDKQNSIYVDDEVNFSKYFKMMAEESQNGLFIYNIPSNVVTWKNFAFRKLMLLGSRKKFDFLESIEKDQKPVVNKMLSLVMETGNRFDGNFSIAKANGRKLECDMFVSKLDDTNVLVELKNVEDRKQLKKLQDQHDFLKSQQLELIEDAKIAGLGTMMGGLSHEINNPLAVIRGRVDIALHKLDAGTLSDEELRHTFERLQVMTKRMSVIIKQLQNFAFGFSSDHVEDISVADMVRESCDLIKTSAESKGVDIRIPELPQGLFFSSVRSPMIQVFFNILNNAIGAASELEEKWVEISIRSS